MYWEQIILGAVILWINYGIIISILPKKLPFNALKLFPLLETENQIQKEYLFQEDHILSKNNLASVYVNVPVEYHPPSFC